MMADTQMTKTGVLKNMFLMLTEIRESLQRKNILKNDQAYWRRTKLELQEKTNNFHNFYKSKAILTKH